LPLAAVAAVDAGSLAPGRVVFDPIGRVSDHEMRYDPVERRRNHRRVRAVAAHQAMAPKHPDVPEPARRILRKGRDLIRIGQPLGPYRKQGTDLDIREARQIELEAELAQFAELEREQRVVPARVQRQLVVGQHIGAPLGLAQARQLDHRH
jgi:hypothetical protein